MRLIVKIVAVLAAFATVRCTTESKKQNPDTGQEKPTTQTPDKLGRSDSLSVLIRSKPRDGELGYQDVFNNYYPLAVGEQSVPMPVVVRDAFRDNQTCFILTHRVDSVQWVIDPASGFWMVRTSSKRYDAELNFDVEYRRMRPQSGTADNGFAFQAKKFVGDPAGRDRAIAALFDRKQAYLRTYAATNHLDTAFLRTWQTAIQYEALLQTLFLSAPLSQWPETYLRRLSGYRKAFDQDDYLYLPQYRQAAWNLLNILHHLSGRAASAGLRSYIETANTHFRGDTREFLVGNLLMNAKHGESGMAFTEQTYQALLNQYLASARNSEFKAYVRAGSSELAPEMAGTALIGVDQQPISLEPVLGKGKLHYVDFWASWCGPCRAEMPASKRLRSEYTRKGVHFLYLSVDQNPAAWQRAMQQIGLSPAESFLLHEGTGSALARQLKIGAIPRYVLMDRWGRVLRAQARRPSDPRVRQELDAALGN